jgi:ABC-type glycerol-3-phosphate transport system substrate-binding protein
LEEKMRLRRSRRVIVRKSVAAVSVAIAVALAVSACGGDGGGSKNNNKLVVQYPSSPEGKTRATEWVKLFNKKYPNVVVQLQPVTNVQTTGTNLQVLTANNAPDIGLVPLETSVYAQMSQGGQLLDLTGVRTAAGVAKRFSPSALAAGTYNNVPYAAPYSYAYYNIVYYNKDLLQSLGVEPQNHRIESVDELKSMVSALKSKGVEGLSIGVADNFQASWLIDGLLPTATTDEQLTNYLTNWQSGVSQTVKYTDSAFVDSLARVKQLADMGAFQKGYLSATVDGAGAKFEQGQVGMFLGGSWQAPTFEADKVKFKVGWALLPPLGSSKKSQLSSYLGDAFGIPKNAKNPEMAKKYLEVILSQAGQEVLAKTGVLPIVNDVPTSTLGDTDPLVKEMIEDTRENGSAVGWSNVVDPEVGAKGIEPIEQEMLSGNGTPQSVAEKIEAALQKVRSP